MKTTNRKLILGFWNAYSQYALWAEGVSLGVYTTAKYVILNACDVDMVHVTMFRKVAR